MQAKEQNAGEVAKRCEIAGKSIFVAGHKGMVGSAIVRRLKAENCAILTADSKELDLRRQASVDTWMEMSRPDLVFLAAAKVGGIAVNDARSADFLYDNLMIEANLIEASFRVGVEKLLFIGSSCIYPKFANQPIVEEALLTGPLESTNEWYAIAKIAGIKLAQAYRKQHGCNFISAMPTNLYGSGDNFDLATSHVLPALIRKAHEAKLRGEKELVMWGTGSPKREFLHADDCADALVFLMENYSGAEHVNVGSGTDCSILDLTKLVCRVVGFQGEITHDLSKPDGTPRKLMDGSKLKDMGWQPHRALEDGIKTTYEWFLEAEAAKV
ncbi:GDP-L-fucose synthase [Labrenzia sp. EL_208]|nr:GDP-L-fucose synthase [Labrenzia sp. EL_132]MBG6229529.1 GDP-L-fucose synthase [Labrenzia sp. EL_208]